MDLRNKAVLVKVTIGAYSARSTSQELIEEVCENHDTARDVVDVGLLIINRKRMKNVTFLGTKLRDFFNLGTLPWQDGGWRLISSTKYMTFSDDLERLAAEYRQAVQADLLDPYDEIKAESKKKLKGLFDESKFPGREHLKRLFYVDFRLQPLAEIGDIRLQGVDRGATQDLQTKLQDQQAQLLHEAEMEVVGRLVSVVSLLKDRLVDTDGRFHKSLVEKIQKVCEALPSLNITENKEIAGLIEKVKSRLSTIEVEEVRKDKVLKQTYAETATEVLNELTSFKG